MYFNLPDFGKIFRTMIPLAIIGSLSLIGWVILLIVWLVSHLAWV